MKMPKEEKMIDVNESISGWIQQTKSKNGNDRRLAASGLRKLAKSGKNIFQAIPALIGLLNDKKPQVRQYAVKALGETGDASVIPPLNNLLNDKKDYVIKSAKLAIIKLSKKEIETVKTKNIQVDSLKSDILTVKELTRYIKNLLEGDKKLNNLFVRGELSNEFRHHKTML